MHAFPRPSLSLPHSSQSRHGQQSPLRRRSSSRRRRQANAGTIARQPLQERQVVPDRNRPDWDFTQSDMSRYKLTPTENLRRNLLRLSKHQDEASECVRLKLRQMQENICNFLPEPRPVSSPSPAFASRTPTGRLPGSGGFSRHRTPEPPALPATPWTQSAALSLPVPHPCADVLELEVEEFLWRKGQSQFKFLRRVADAPADAIEPFLQSADGRAAERTEKGPISSSVSSQRLSACDAELDNIEESAEQLKSQLAWWQQHRAVLGLAHELRDSVDGGDDEAYDELKGESEWLLVSESSSDSECDSTSDNEVANVAQKHSADGAGSAVQVQFGSDKHSELWPLDEDFLIGAPGRGSLSELIARQAAELVSSTLLAAARLEGAADRSEDIPSMHSTESLVAAFLAPHCSPRFRNPMALEEALLLTPKASRFAATPATASTATPQASCSAASPGSGSVARRTPLVQVSKPEPGTPPPRSWIPDDAGSAGLARTLAFALDWAQDLQAESSTKAINMAKSRGHQRI